MGSMRAARRKQIVYARYAFIPTLNVISHKNATYEAKSMCYTECFFPLKVEFLLHDILLASLRLGSDKLSGFKLTLRNLFQTASGSVWMLSNVTQ